MPIPMYPNEWTNLFAVTAIVMVAWVSSRVNKPWSYTLAKHGKRYPGTQRKTPIVSWLLPNWVHAFFELIVSAAIVAGGFLYWRNAYFGDLDLWDPFFGVLITLVLLMIIWPNVFYHLSDRRTARSGMISAWFAWVIVVCEILAATALTVFSAIKDQWWPFGLFLGVGVWFLYVLVINSQFAWRANMIYGPNGLQEYRNQGLSQYSPSQGGEGDEFTRK
jgi:hypothetical protein